MTDKKVLKFAIGLVAIVALVIIVVAVFSPTGAPTKVPLAAAQPTTTAQPVATIQPSTTPKPPTAAPTSSPTSLPTTTIAPAITATPDFANLPTATAVSADVIPTITNGPEYPTEFAQAGLYIKPLAGTPIVSREDALKAIFSRGGSVSLTIVSDHQIVVDGQTILYTAYYGLVTDGFRKEGGPWAGGFLNIRLANCTGEGKCAESGEVLDHIENRPMWLIDLQVTTAISRATCPPAGTPCPIPLLDNHTVDLVDAQTLMFLGGMSYYQP